MSASPPKATVDFQNLFGREGPLGDMNGLSREGLFADVCRAS